MCNHRGRVNLTVLFRDRHGDGFDLGVIVQAVLAELSADARLLVAPEGRRGREGVVGVDPDGSRPQGVADVHCLAQVLGEHCGSQPVVVPET